MDDRDREALHLLIGGFRTSEIADILGITPKAASMRLCRARDRLKDRLRAAGGGEPKMPEASGARTITNRWRASLR